MKQQAVAVWLYSGEKYLCCIKAIRTSMKAGFQYTFNVPEDTVAKDVHWYLMMADSYYSKPQREEYFIDSGYYKYHEAYHLLKFTNEKMILEKAYSEYLNLKKNNLWGNRKYF